MKRLFVLSLLAANLSVASVGFGQTSQREKARESTSRFFEMQRKSAEVAKTAVGPNRVAAAAAAKADPGMNASRARMLQHQQNRVPELNALSFVANNPLMAEVEAGPETEFAQILFWNETALRMTAIDHTPLAPGSVVDTHPHEQFGPTRTSRVLAIVHIAMFEAVNAVDRRYASYQGIQAKIFSETQLPSTITRTDISVRHAIAYAAYLTLVSLYPNKSSDLTLTLSANLAALQEPSNNAIAGMAVGNAAAKAIMDLRKNDGSELPEPDVAGYLTTDPYKWQRDPLNADPAIALGGNWHYVKPFVIQKADQFRPDAPPAPSSPGFKDAFNDVLAEGGDPDAGKLNPPGNADRRPTNTTRTPEETFIGKFWAYDATALLCAPPRLYNMIATSLALNEKKSTITDAVDLARFLALVNVGLADAGIAAWEAKYYYLYPRPITLIRQVTPQNSPIAAPMPFWTPLGAPVSNATQGKMNFSPPFPAYPSGHAVFGGTLFQIFRKYWNDNDGPKFTFVSDEYNGKNSDPGAPAPRARTPVTFMTPKPFAEAETQNARSRIFLGIHWQFDATSGIMQGNKVGDYVYDHVFAKLP